MGGQRGCVRKNKMRQAWFWILLYAFFLKFRGQLLTPIFQSKFAKSRLCPYPPSYRISLSLYSECRSPRRAGISWRQETPERTAGARRSRATGPGLRELKTDVSPFIGHLHDHYAPDPNLPGIFDVHPRACDCCDARFLRFSIALGLRHKIAAPKFLLLA